MKKVIVGITGSSLFEGAGLFAGYERLYTNKDYVDSVLRAGAAPIMLPTIEDEETIMRQLDAIDALIVMGGYDVDPSFFGEEPLNCLGEVFPKRDIFEIALLKEAIKRGIPTLGICRGMQIMNVCFGGSLYQDISLIKRDILIQHNQKARPFTPTHSIKMEEGTIMKEVFGKEERVNSYHHMAVNRVAKDFIVSSRAPDGIIESIEHKDGLMMGVQFHPEMLSAKYPSVQNLFNTLVKKASN